MTENEDEGDDTADDRLFNKISDQLVQYYNLTHQIDLNKLAELILNRFEPKQKKNLRILIADTLWKQAKVLITG